MGEIIAPDFHAGVMVGAGPDLRLIGARCPSCGQTFFPAPMRCLACGSATLGPLTFDRSAVLESFTTVQMPATSFAPPYTVGYVRLSEGPRVFAPILVDGQMLTIGMPVTLMEIAIGRGETDRRRAYGFRPLPPAQT